MLFFYFFLFRFLYMIMGLAIFSELLLCSVNSSFIVILAYDDNDITAERWSLQRCLSTQGLDLGSFGEGFL